ncbi:MAG: hypothetical protein AAF322_02275 [Pseudomonadota bacterium]
MRRALLVAAALAAPVPAAAAQTDPEAFARCAGVRAALEAAAAHRPEPRLIAAAEAASALNARGDGVTLSEIDEQTAHAIMSAFAQALHETQDKLRAPNGHLAADAADRAELILDRAAPHCGGGGTKEAR